MKKPYTKDAKSITESTTVAPNKCVYVLIGFNARYLAARANRHKEELLHRKLRKMEKAGKDVSKQMTAQKDRMQAGMLEFLRATHGGYANLGVFESKKDILHIIQSEGYGISEAGYYSTVLIERKPFGYQAFDCSKGAETWFQLKDDDKYHRVRKPACFGGTFGFA